MKPTTIEEWLREHHGRDLLIGVWGYSEGPRWQARAYNEHAVVDLLGKGKTEAEAREHLEMEMTKAGILAPSVGITDDRPPEPDLAARVERLEVVLHEMRDALDGLRQPEPKPWVVEGGEEPKKPELPTTLDEWERLGPLRRVDILAFDDTGTTSFRGRASDGLDAIVETGYFRCIAHAKQHLLSGMRSFGHIAPGDRIAPGRPQ